MKLPYKRSALSILDHMQLLTAVRERRTVIRYCRDQVGDDRCWLDDYRLYAMVEGLPPGPKFPPPFDVAMFTCWDFYKTRRNDVVPVIPPDAITDPAHWDDDLLGATGDILLEKLVKQQCEFAFWIQQPPGPENDQWLYDRLPEKLRADFRLPPEEEFLGEAKAPKAGCPSFWRSHGQCGGAGCDLTRWGPCGNHKLQ